jgi:hypothetical protein
MERNTMLLALAALVWLWFGLSAAAHAQFLVIGDDNKLYWDDTGKTVFTEPGKDEVVIVDIKDPEAPKIVASLPLMNTVIGPPTNLGITPDESLALVADSLAYQPAGAGWKPVPDNKLFVIDLQSKPRDRPYRTIVSAKMRTLSTISADFAKVEEIANRMGEGSLI